MEGFFKKKLKLNTFWLLLFLLITITFLPGLSCTQYEEDMSVSQLNEDAAAYSADYDRFHYVVRARNYTLDLADRIRELTDPQVPSIVMEAEAAAQGLDNAMATFRVETPDAHQRIEDALVRAARAARKAFDIAESSGLNPPDVPNVPYFSQTFSDVHKTP